MRASRLRRWRLNSRWTTNGSSIGGVICSLRALYARAGAIKRRLLAVPEDGAEPNSRFPESATGGIHHDARMEQRRFLRIGHKGAAALAPENTIGSLAAALEVGVDMVEFDVVDAPAGRHARIPHSRRGNPGRCRDTRRGARLPGVRGARISAARPRPQVARLRGECRGRAPAARPGRALDRLLVLPGKPAGAATVRARTANGNLVSARQAGVGATAGALSGDPGRGGGAAFGASASHRAHGQGGGGRLGHAPFAVLSRATVERCTRSASPCSPGPWTMKSCSPRSSRPAWTE